jgi:uncharacterized protein YndB with AHSA1/START domain
MSNQTNQPTIPPRTFETAVELPLPIERVWEAIATGDELARWFPLSASVTPGPTGTVTWSWGEGMAGTSAIEVWDPPRRLRIGLDQPGPWSGGPTDGAGPWHVTTDFILEGRGGVTVLRLVQSGFGTGRGWDDDYDSISNGWKFELRSLRHYLSRHAGKDRAVAWERGSAGDRPAAEVWALLTGPRGLCREGTIAGLAPGAPYRVRLADGEWIEGEVVLNNPGRSFVGTVRGAGEALLRMEIETSCPPGPFFWMSFWGDARPAAGAWGRRLKGILDGLFPPASNGGAR